MGPYGFESPIKEKRPLTKVEDEDRAVKDGTSGTSNSPLKSSNSKAKLRMQTKMLYANDSIFATVAYNWYFENTTIGIIVLNAVWLGIDTQLNHAMLKDETGKLPLEPWSFMVENFFCVYFTFEVVIRLLSFRQKKDAMWDGWFVFDSILVIMMIVETWIMIIIAEIMGGGESADFLANFSVFRLLRLLRLTRIARIMKAFPELLTLVKSMVSAAKAVSWILLFLTLVLYVFGILFTVQMMDAPRTRPEGYLEKVTEAALSSLSPDLAPLAPLIKAPAEEFGACEGEEDLLAGDMFKSLGDSMMNLFTRGVLGDNLQETCDSIKAQSNVMQWAFFIFFGLTFALLLNMLIGVLVEVVSSASKDEEETLCVNDLKLAISNAFSDMDQNQDGIVCQEEWERINDSDEVRGSLVGIGMEEERVDQQLEDMSALIFQHEELRSKTDRDSDYEMSPSITQDGRLGFTVERLIDKVLEFRPGQPASALDLELVKSKVSTDNKAFKKKLENIEENVRKVLGPTFKDEELSVMGTGSMSMTASMSMLGKPEDRLRKAALAPVLQEIPTDTLFRELERRAAPQPGSNAPHHLRVNADALPLNPPSVYN